MKLILTLMLILIASLCTAQTAQNVEIIRGEQNPFYGRLVAEVDGSRVTIAQEAADYWLMNNGRTILYSGPEGAGGFENEGQALWRYDVSTGEKRKLMSELYVIFKVVEVESASGRSALLVTMRDGGLGAKHVAVVNPRTGEVWREDTAFFVAVRNGRIAVADYEAQDFARDVDDPGKLRRLLYFNIDKLLNRPYSTTKPVGVEL